ncbi:MAG: FimB/Mfa2 family fimbrial subunit [Alistipes sp.]|nr:FimB/Mfa2 family fimbrial subunit [Alistipes sp.]
MVKRIKYLPLALLALLSGSVRCVNQSYNTDDCQTEQGLEVSFFSQSRCQDDALYPEDISQMSVFVFDGNGLLAYHRTLSDITLGEDYTLSIPTDPGLYWVVAWAGLDGDYLDISEPQDGVTRKDDLLFAIKRTDGTAGQLPDVPVYFGESAAVYVDPGENSSEEEYRAVGINLLEITNRITVSVEGLPTDSVDYAITIEADNGSMDYDGSILYDDVLVYEPSLTYGDASVEGEFTLLKLETGFNYYIVVSNIISGTELYRGSLLGTLLLKNPEVDLNCDHDFTIRFTAEDQCDCGTYTIVEIWVNNWLVHSYDTEF